MCSIKFVENLMKTFPDIQRFVSSFLFIKTRYHYADFLKLSESFDFWKKKREGIYE